jgi:hypothetical protein
MAKSKVNLKPQKATPNKGKGLLRKAEKAWWYEDEKGIDVYIAAPGQNPLSCRVQKSQLVAWLKRVGAKRK